MRAIAFLVFLMGGAVRGQAPAARPQFEVADVRVNKATGADVPVQILIDGVPVAIEPNPNGVSRLLEQPFAPGGRVSLRYVTMRTLIAIAYKTEILRDEYLSGGPNWIDSDHFDVIAKAPPGTSMETERLMIQAVLEERFHLRVHREQRPMPIYALISGKGVVSKAQLRLRTAIGVGDPNCNRIGDQSHNPGTTHVACTNMTMADLVAALPDLAPDYMDRPALDQTRLSGAYDFELDWAWRRKLDTAGGLTIFGAVEKLGLKLEERKQPMATIVIDHVERTPTEN